MLGTKHQGREGFAIGVGGILDPPVAVDDAPRGEGDGATAW